MKSLVCQAQHLELNPLLYGQPMKLSKDWDDMFILPSIGCYPSGSVLCSLNALKLALCNTIEFPASRRELTNAWAAVFAASISRKGWLWILFYHHSIQHILYHPLFDFNHASLDFVDRYISTILVNRLECQVQLVIICIYMELNPKFS